MATATMEAAARRTTTARAIPKATAGVCGLTLRINGASYRVRPLRGEPGSSRAFRLTRPDGTAHDVIRQPYGAECSCGDWVFRRDGIDPKGCKHIRACRAVGLID